jgi:hypothetical protein
MSGHDARPTRTRAQLLAAGMLIAAPLQAQQTAREGWLDRVSVAAQYGVLRPAGGSELYTLIDRALAPGTRALRPKLAGGELRVRVLGPLRLVLGAEAGGSTVASTSRVGPVPESAEVRQQTALDLTSVQYAGANWQALRWRARTPDAADRARLVLGAGGGVARYRLRQWGTFVDAQRALAFDSDFRSAGRGAFGYASAAVEVPVQRWVTLQAELRRQAGSARMSADYASFDRLDIGGTRLSAGVVLHPARMLGSRR